MATRTSSIGLPALFVTVTDWLEVSSAITEGSAPLVPSAPFSGFETAVHADRSQLAAIRLAVRECDSDSFMLPSWVGYTVNLRLPGLRRKSKPAVSLRSPRAPCQHV